MVNSCRIGIVPVLQLLRNYWLHLGWGEKIIGRIQFKEGCNNVGNISSNNNGLTKMWVEVIVQAGKIVAECQSHQYVTARINVDSMFGSDSSVLKKRADCWQAFHPSFNSTEWTGCDGGFKVKTMQEAIKELSMDWNTPVIQTAETDSLWNVCTYVVECTRGGVCCIMYLIQSL